MTSLDQKSKQKLREFYEANLVDNHENHAALGWESKEAQHTRFSILTNHVHLSGKSVLDVGCGFGDLYDFIVAQNIGDFTYTGIDLTDKVIEKARLQNPNLHFVAGDILNSRELLGDRTYDVVYSSGIFNYKIEDNLAFLRKSFDIFSRHASEYVVFNLLSDTSLDKEEEFYYYSAEKIADYIDVSRLRNFVVVDGYLHNDFTVVCKV